MASNAKFCSQCASPLPEPNPPFCNQCGTAVKPNDVQPTVPSQPMPNSGSSNNPISSSPKYQLPKKNNTSRTSTPKMGLYIALCLLTVIIFPVGWIAGAIYLWKKRYLLGGVLIGIGLLPFVFFLTIELRYDDDVPIESTESPYVRIWDVGLSDEANLKTQLEQALGGTNRDVPRIDTVLIYERPTASSSVNAIAITVAIKQGGSSNADIREDITEILRVVDKSPINDYKELYVNVTKHGCDNYGNCGEKTFVHKGYYKTTIDRINWNNFDSFDVYDIADYIPID